MFTETIERVIDRVDNLRHEVDDHWQIPRDEARLLAQIVRIGRFRSLCEIGVSYGFSTLHLSAAAREHGGHVHAIDISDKKIRAATKNLSDAGLINHVTLYQGDARDVLKGIHPEQPFDFVFLDADKQQSPAYLDAVWDQLADRTVLVTDNTHTHPDELAGFLDALRSKPGVSSCDVPVGNGFELTVVTR
ncbi:MAG: hypothetical protein Kow00105_15670 [Phycisphaeraceae bacterium]